MTDKEVSVYEWLAEVYSGIAPSSQIKEWMEQAQNPTKARIEILQRQHRNILDMMNNEPDSLLYPLMLRNIKKIQEQLLTLTMPTK